MTSQPTTDGKLDADAVQGFVDGTREAVLRPGEAGHDDARAIWNGLFDRRPALILQCTGPADVVDVVNFAREQDLLLSINPVVQRYASSASPSST
jgi:hypothetical protein